MNTTDGFEFNNFSYNSTNGFLHMIYSGLYSGVRRANIVIAAVPEVNMDKALQSRYIAEAKFLRAFYYWQLTNLWGDVILLTVPLKSPAEALIAKSSKAVVTDFIIKDLQEAIAVLPVSYGASDVGRATKGAAQALLGKVYLYAQDYVNAESLLNQVIKSGVYDLMDDFRHVWNRDYENNKESIFEVQFADIGGTGINDFNRVALPRVNGATGTFNATQRIVDAFPVNDPRLGFSVFREGDVFAPELSTSSLNLDVYKSVWSTTGYNIKKGVVPIMFLNGNDNNYPLIRYADVLLMYAEAANELGLIDEARDAVNIVRRRPTVNMPVLTALDSGTKQAMFNAIVHERQVELAFENHRFNDLRRWGLADSVLGSSGYLPKHRYFPIPQPELDINPQLVQNAGW
jgi:hypothetical protein